MQCLPHCHLHQHLVGKQKDLFARDPGTFLGWKKCQKRLESSGTAAYLVKISHQVSSALSYLTSEIGIEHGALVFKLSVDVINERLQTVCMKS